jgi:LysM repeat protein
MNDFMGTLKGKLGPFPVWVWAGLGTILLAVFLMRKKSQSGNDKAAADQSNADLGSAAELANMFTVAGLMPYQGGDVYVNTTTTTPPPKSGGTPWQPPKPPVHALPVLPKPGSKPTKPTVPKPRATYVVKKNDTLTKIAKQYGVSVATLWKYNTTAGVRPAQTIATLKKRGPNLIFPNEKILIPPKGYK